MIMRRKPAGPEHPLAVKARRRIDTVGRAEALLWADNAGSTMARSLSEFQKSGDTVHLDDAESSLLSLLGCIASLRARSQNLP